MKRIRSEAAQLKIYADQKLRYATDPIYREKHKSSKKRIRGTLDYQEKQKAYQKKRRADNPSKCKAMDRASSTKSYAKLLREKEARLINQLCKGNNHESAKM